MVEETVKLPPMDDLAKAQFKFHAFTEACNDGRAVMIAMRHKDNNQRAFVTCVIDIAVEAGGIVNGEIRPVGFVIPDDDIFQSYNPPDIQGIIDQFLAARKAQADLMAAEEERINNFERDE